MLVHLGLNSCLHVSSISQDGSLAMEIEPPMSLRSYMCNHTVCSIPAGALTRYCVWRGIKNANKVNHRERVRMILTDANMSKEYIQECVDSIPVREKRKTEAAGQKNIFRLHVSSMQSTHFRVTMCS